VIHIRFFELGHLVVEDAGFTGGYIDSEFVGEAADRYMRLGLLILGFC